MACQVSAGPQSCIQTSASAPSGCCCAAHGSSCVLISARVADTTESAVRAGALGGAHQRCPQCRGCGGGGEGPAAAAAGGRADAPAGASAVAEPLLRTVMSSWRMKCHHECASRTSCDMVEPKRISGPGTAHESCLPQYSELTSLPSYVKGSGGGADVRERGRCGEGRRRHPDGAPHEDAAVGRDGAFHALAVLLPLMLHAKTRRCTTLLHCPEHTR